jgi:hypothetical protein
MKLTCYIVAIFSSAVYQIRVIKNFNGPAWKIFLLLLFTYLKKLNQKVLLYFRLQLLQQAQISERVIVRLDELFSSQVKVNI